MGNDTRYVDAPSKMLNNDYALLGAWHIRHIYYLSNVSEDITRGQEIGKCQEFATEGANKWERS